jgi:hypothetical protein
MEDPNSLALPKREYSLKNRTSLGEKVVKPYFNVESMNFLAGTEFNDEKPQQRISDLKPQPRIPDSNRIYLKSD